MRPLGLEQRHRAVERFGLLLAADFERARAHPPLGVGIAPPRAGAGAGRIDQHEVDAAGEVGEHVADRFRRAAPARCARPRARAGRGSARGVACRYRWRGSGPCSPSRRRARASCRRRRRTDRPPARRACAAASNAASCEPSSWISIRPLMKAGSAWIAGILRVGLSARCAGRPATSASARARARRARRAPPRARPSAC